MSESTISNLTDGLGFREDIARALVEDDTFIDRYRALYQEAIEDSPRRSERAASASNRQRPSSAPRT